MVMAAWNVRLFGKLAVSFNEQLLGGLDAARVQELFCYLILHRDRPLTRETLASVLWEESPSAQSRKNLRQALWHLQMALNPRHEPDGRSVLVVGPDWVRFNAEADLWIDVVAFERAFDRSRQTPSHDLDEPTVQGLEEAVQLYRGDLLEGSYPEWCLYERQRLQDLYLTMLDKLAGYCQAHEQYEAGMTYAAAILRYDRACERAHRRLMRMQYLSGDRTTALRQYARCAAALHEELGTVPSQRTQALQERIRADTLSVDSPEMSDALLPGGTAAAGLPDLLERLGQLQQLLIRLQREVRQEVQAVQRALCK